VNLGKQALCSAHQWWQAKRYHKNGIQRLVYLIFISECSKNFSLNFIPLPLDKFPATFGIQDEGKSFFPHYYNTSANIDAPPLPTLPAKNFYGYNAMKVGKRLQFLKWYKENVNSGSFSLKEQLPIYCLSDVRLLAEGIVAYRRMFLEESGFEVFRKSTTLASAVMYHYRLNVLEENTIGIASQLSYERHDKQSGIATKFLKYFAWKHQVDLQHVDSPGGEMRLPGTNMRVDGYVRGGLDGNSRDLILEINGFNNKNKNKKS
jgi:hypothetical protein